MILIFAIDRDRKDRGKQIGRRKLTSVLAHSLSMTTEKKTYSWYNVSPSFSVVVCNSLNSLIKRGLVVCFKNGEYGEKNTDVELTPDGEKLVEELQSRIKKCIGISLLDKEGIHYSATPSDYWTLDDNFVFEDMILTGIELKKSGRREEYFIKSGPIINRSKARVTTGDTC